MLPLLIAVRGRASGAVVEKLLALYPEAVKEKISDQKLPLHHAAVHTSEAVVRALIKADPDALKAEDKFKKRPLTYAVQKNEALEAFLPFPEAVPLSLNGGAPCRRAATAVGHQPRRRTHAVAPPNRSSTLGTSGRSTRRV